MFQWFETYKLKAESDGLDMAFYFKNLFSLIFYNVFGTTSLNTLMYLTIFFKLIADSSSRGLWNLHTRCTFRYALCVYLITHSQSPVRPLRPLHEQTSASMVPGGQTSSAFYTCRTRTSTKFERIKMHSVACQLLKKKPHVFFFSNFKKILQKDSLLSNEIH